MARSPLRQWFIGATDGQSEFRFHGGLWLVFVTSQYVDGQLGRAEGPLQNGPEGWWV
jgi:hypothetical protein